MGIRVGFTDLIGCASTLLFLDRYLRGFNCGTRNAQISPNSLAPMIGRDTQSPVNRQDVAPLARGLSAATLPAPTIRLALLSESALFRSGLHRLLGTDRSFVVTEIKTLPIRDALRRSAAQIFLVDAHVTGALEICRELRLNGVRPWSSSPARTETTGGRSRP